MSRSSLVSALVRALRWPDTALCDTVRTIRLDALTSALGTVLGSAQRTDGLNGGDLLGQIGELPDSAWTRLLDAPELFYRLRHSGVAADAAAEFIADGVDAERRVLGSEVAAAGRGGSAAVWTAAGDWYFPPHTTISDYAPDTKQAGFAADRVYHAPRLSNGIPVDFSSPWRRGKLPDVAGDDAVMTLSERVEITARLDDAVEAVTAASPVAADHVAQLNRVIVPRKDSDSRRRYRSTSTRVCPGRLILRNVDVGEATVEELMDGLVHETIHCMIDLIELREPLVVDLSRSASVKAVSPWTGRALDLDTYLQACFVWFGLWNLWFGAFDSGAVTPRSALRYMDTCARGFVSADIAARLAAVRAPVPATVIDALEEMQSGVRSDFGLLEESTMTAGGA